MTDEVTKQLAKEIAELLKPDIEKTTEKCVGEHCERIRKTYEEIAESQEEETAEARRWGELLRAVDDRIGALEERINSLFEPAEEEEEKEERECPNCGYDKKRKPKFVGHCSQEGKDVRFSDYEKELDWEHCPNCGADIVWEDED